MAFITSPTIITVKNAVDSVVTPVTRTFKFAGSLVVTNTGPNEATITGAGMGDAWAVVGNAGAGLILGTNTNDQFDFVQNAKKVSGFEVGGVNYLKTHDNFSGSENRRKTAVMVTLDQIPTVISNVPVEDNSVGFILVRLQARRDTSGSLAVFERKIAVKMISGTLEIMNRVNTTFTERFNCSYDVNFSISGSDILINVIGESGHEVYWSSTIEYQFIKNNI